MKEDPKAFADPEPEEHEDIEILEVVGLNEDAPPPSDRDPDEIEVTFDGDGAKEPRGVAPAGSPAPRSTEEPDEGMRERLLRLQADFDNFKKRIEREKDDYYRHATASLVARMLPVIDNFERALATEPRSEGEEALHQGVALIHRQLMEELKREGLRPLESEGQPFDPSMHEAIATDASSNAPPSTVVEEVQRGYFFQDRLLRPAAVRVSVDASEVAVPGDGGEES